MGALRVPTNSLRVLVKTVAFLFAVGLTTATADDITKHAVWITGEVFKDNGLLLFRMDKPVSGNTAGNIVLLGATKQTMNAFLPAYMKAAEKRMKVRLYGILTPAAATTPAIPQPMPSVQFITWKMHLPSDPDELSERDKVPVGPTDTVPGYTISPKAK